MVVKWCVVLLVVLAGVSGGYGQGMMGGLLNPRLGQLQTSFDYSGGFYGDADVDDQDEEMSFCMNEWGLFVPVDQGEDYEWGLMSHVGLLKVNTGAVLPDTGELFPDDLWDVGLGALGRKRLGNGWIGGLGVWVGSASDKPFGSGDEVMVSAMGSLQVPANDELDWLFMLYLSNDREFLPYIPLPGVGVHYHPSRRFSAVVGVPFVMLRMEPIDRLEVEASYMLLRNVHAKVAYEVADGVKVYGGYDWDHLQYWRYDRSDEDDYLYYYEMRVAGGVEVALTEQASLDMSVGYAFDRMWFEGEDYDDRDQQRLDPADGAYGRVGLEYRF